MTSKLVEFTEVELFSSVEQMVEEFRFDEDLPSELTEYERTFKGSVGESDIMFTTTEVCHQEIFYNLVSKLHKETPMSSTCPIFLVECGFIEVPNCKKEVYISHECGVYGLIWNSEDDESLFEWLVNEIENLENV